jgi:hypothetical protein
MKLSLSTKTVGILAAIGAVLGGRRDHRRLPRGHNLPLAGSQIGKIIGDMSTQPFYD